MSKLHRARAVRGARLGFTLIELLVVVAVIALLIAILLPSLSKAREQTKSAVCKSNVHQIGVAMTMYTIDEKYFPAHHTNFGSPWVIVWPPRLLKYAKSQSDVFSCPSAPPDAYWNGHDKIVTGLAAATNPTLLGTFSYGINDWGVRETFNVNIAPGLPMQNLGLGGWVVRNSGSASQRANGEVKVDRVKQPSQMIAVGDNNSDGEWDTAIDPYEDAEPVGKRHNKGANVVFCDGHAEWRYQNKWIEPVEHVRRLWNNDYKPHKDLWLD